MEIINEYKRFPCSWHVCVLKTCRTLPRSSQTRVLSSGSCSGTDTSVLVLNLERSDLRGGECGTCSELSVEEKWFQDNGKSSFTAELLGASQPSERRTSWADLSPLSVGPSLRL